MFYRVKDNFNRSIFNFYAKKILLTAPVKVECTDVIIVIQLGHKDLLMAIASVKSFMFYAGNFSVCFIDDGTLSSNDYDILEKHFIGAVFKSIKDIKTGICPHGGTWERLKVTSDFAQNKYVVQIDSDTLTVGPVLEIVECISKNIPFVMPSSDNSVINIIDIFSEKALKLSSDHIQVLSERAFKDLPKNSPKNYIRGCSGDSGFPSGIDIWPNIENFSKDMMTILGKRWCEWGTEQITSNYVISNLSNTLVLPSDKYSLHSPSRNIDNSVHLHFYGTYRFKNGTYKNMIKKMTLNLLNY